MDASLEPVALVKLSICLHSLVSHIQLLSPELPSAIMSDSQHHLDAVIIRQTVSLTPTGSEDKGGQVE